MNESTNNRNIDTPALMRERIEGVFHPILRHRMSKDLETVDVQCSMINIRGRRLWGLASAIPVGAFLLAALPLLTAFEAHVVNVTAKIERRPVSCDARSLGYWANHDGCKKGQGESIHEQKIREISQGLMGAFASYTGKEICRALWMPNCGSGGVRAGQLCRARAHTLADLSNIAAGVLDTSALIAAADDGTIAFDRLGLTPYSSVDEALTAIELIILDPGANALDLRNAAYVAQRIYSFYEDENPFAPRCIYDPDDVPLCFERASDKQFRNKSATAGIVSELSAAVVGGADALTIFGALEDIADESDVVSNEDINGTRSARESRAHTGGGNNASSADGGSEHGRGVQDDGGGEDSAEESAATVSSADASASDEAAATTMATTTAEGSAADEAVQAATCDACESAPAENSTTEETAEEGADETSEVATPVIEEGTADAVVDGSETGATEGSTSEEVDPQQAI